MLWGNYIHRPYCKIQYLAGLANCGYSRPYYRVGPMFIRAEWTDNWELHLHCVRQMLPHFHAAGHIAYMLSLRISLPNRCYNCHIRCQPKSSVNSRRRLLHNSVTGEILELIVFRPNHRAIWSKPARDLSGGM